MKKILKSSLIGAIILCVVIIGYQIFNIINAKSVSDIIESGGSIATENKIPIYVEDIVEGLGTSIDYSVFANKFTQQTHMEGNIAVKDAYISQIFNFTTATIKVNRSNSYSITVDNKVNGTQADGTFKFALFTKDVSSEDGEEKYIRTSHDIITVTTKDGEGTATFRKLDPDTKYYIFQLDENDNPIMNNAVTSDGTTITYGDDEIVIKETNLKNINTSYIENIEQWHNNAADGNDGENPKLVIPMKEYQDLAVDANGYLTNNGAVILSSDPKDFELIVVGEDGKNYTVVYKSEDGTYELQERAKEYKTINFDSEFTKLNRVSSILYNVATSSEEVSVINLDADGPIYKDGQVNGLNNGNADSEILDLKEYLKDDKFLVINVDTSGLERINLQNKVQWDESEVNLSWNELSTRILWNFYNKEDNSPYTGEVYIGKNYIMGTMLAPSAKVTVGATINASVIANESSNPGGEIHKSQFNQSRSKKKMACYMLKKEIEPGKVSLNLKKVDSLTLEALENSEFKIMIKNGNTVLFEKTETTKPDGTISTGEIDLPKEEQTYTVSIEEITPPEGYNACKKIEFEFNVVLNDYKYEVESVNKYIKDGVEIEILRDSIDVTVPNEKIKEIKGSFSIKLIKKDGNNDKLLNDIIFDGKVLDENNNEVEFINKNNGEKINFEGLVTGKNEEGIISIDNINIDGEKNYTLILTERPNDVYKPINPITIKIQTIQDNEEYKLGEVTLDDENREDVILEKENNTIVLNVKNIKEIIGSYNVCVRKINSITKEGLDGVKFHIRLYDTDDNIIYDKKMATQNIEGKAGFININNIEITKSGIYKCEISEIESLDGYKKFNQVIMAEIEVDVNDEKDGYVIKSLKNKGLFTENLKMEIEENTNNIYIVLANDPLDDEDEVHISPKPELPIILPQTGDLGMVFVKIITSIIVINIIFGVKYLINKKDE